MSRDLQSMFLFFADQTNHENEETAPVHHNCIDHQCHALHGLQAFPDDREVGGANEQKDPLHSHTQHSRADR